MRVLVVCTGNVARSVAMAAVLRRRYPDVEIASAAVGRNARRNLSAKRRMREVMERHGYGDEAAQHRSQLYADLPWVPDLIIAMAPVHMRRLAEIAPDVPAVLCEPKIPDPAFGSIEEHERAWQLINQAADGIVLS